MDLHHPMEHSWTGWKQLVQGHFLFLNSFETGISNCRVDFPGFSLLSLSITILKSYSYYNSKIFCRMV